MVMHLRIHFVNKLKIILFNLRKLMFNVLSLEMATANLPIIINKQYKILVQLQFTCVCNHLLKQVIFVMKDGGASIYRPVSKSSLATSRLPSMQAKCSGVICSSSKLLKSAPASIRHLATEREPWLDATCKGVISVLSLA